MAVGRGFSYDVINFKFVSTEDLVQFCSMQLLNSCDEYKLLGASRLQWQFAHDCLWHVFDCDFSVFFFKVRRLPKKCSSLNLQQRTGVRPLLVNHHGCVECSSGTATLCSPLALEDPEGRTGARGTAVSSTRQSGATAASRCQSPATEPPTGTDPGHVIFRTRDIAGHVT